MKKYFKLLLCAAFGLGAFTACEDVPAPYNIPSENPKPVNPTADYILNQTFTSSLGEFISQSESGDLAWTSSSKYGAIITGYDDWNSTGTKSNKPGVTLLLSPIINLTGCDSAYVIIDQAINYAKTTLNEDHAMLIRIGDGAWATLPMTFDGLGTSFTYVSQNIQIPQEFIGKSVQIALKHIAHDSYSSTWEVKSLSVAKGQAPAGNSDTPVEGLVGSGTKDDPYDVPSTIKLIAAGPPSTKIYTKGKISKIDEIDTGPFGNATYYISNDGTTTDQLEVYRGYGLGGAKFTSTNDLKVGDDVIVYGVVVYYNNMTMEFTQGSELYMLNGEYASGTPTPTGTPTGTGTKEDPYNIVAAAAASGNAWVQAYIVGWIEGQKIAEGAHFNGTSTVASNLLIADTPDETDVNKCMPVQLPSGTDARSALNLLDNPGNYKKQVKLYGLLDKYFGVAGLRSVSEYVIDGSTPTPQPDEAIFSEPFSASQGAFTIDNKNLPSAISSIWTFSSSYGMVATAYEKNSRKNYDGEAWLISPEIDLTNVTNATLTFSHGANYFKGECKDECSVLAKAAGESEWSTLNVKTWPANDFKFVSSGDVDLKAYVGKKMQIAFRYTSTDTKAGTWEIKKVLVEERAAEDGDSPNPDSGVKTLANFTNGDFETWADGQPTGWKTASTAGNATLSQSTEAHGGQYSVCVQGATSGNKRLGYQEMQLEAGTYNCSFWVRTQSGSGGSVCPGYAIIGTGNPTYMYDKKEGSNSNNYVDNLTTTWQQVSYSFTLDEQKTVCLIIMNQAKSTGAINVLIDDFTITKN